MIPGVVNVKVDLKVKKAAQKVASSLGFSLSSLINAYLRQLIRDRSVGFSDVRLELTPYAKKMLRGSEEEMRAGKAKSYTPSEYLAYLDTMINNEENSRKRRFDTNVRKAVTKVAKKN